MKIKKFNESFSYTNLHEYCIDLFDVGYTAYGLKPNADFFMLFGDGNIEEVETFKDRIEEMEDVRVSWQQNPQTKKIFILCIDKEHYNELKKRMDLYFSFVYPVKKKWITCFMFDNKRNRVDPYDGVSFTSGNYCISYTVDIDNNMFCRQDIFYELLVSKVGIRDPEFIGGLIKLLFFDYFDIELGCIVKKHFSQRDYDLILSVAGKYAK